MDLPNAETQRRRRANIAPRMRDLPTRKRPHFRGASRRQYRPAPTGRRSAVNLASGHIDCTGLGTLAFGLARLASATLHRAPVPRRLVGIRTEGGTPRGFGPDPHRRRGRASARRFGLPCSPIPTWTRRSRPTGRKRWNGSLSSTQTLSFSDLVMPRMDGFELLRHLKECGDLTPAIPAAINARLDRRRSTSVPAGVWVGIPAIPPAMSASPTRSSFHV